LLARATLPRINS